MLRGSGTGTLPKREILTGLGPVPVRVLKVRSRTEERVLFRLTLVPLHVRRARTVDAALPRLYLKGISTGQMAEALAVLVGPGAKGLSAPVVSRLKRQWRPEGNRDTSLREGILDLADALDGR